MRKFLLALLILSALTLILWNITTFYIYKSSITSELNGENLSSIYTLLIPGASVYYNDIPSPVLTERLDKGIKLFNKYKKFKIILTGDGKDKSYNEVRSMHKYLLLHGIPEQQIFLDFEGYSTFESIRNSRIKFKTDHIIIISQDYHLPRALYIAKNLGIKAKAISANSTSSNEKSGLWSHGREFLALFAAFYDIYFNKKFPNVQH